MNLKLGIDASNIRRGGGVTHLVQLLGAAIPQVHGFQEVIVWGGTSTLAAIADRPWLRKAFVETLDGNLVGRVLWQKNRLSALAREASCDLLFIPGGSFAGDFRPVATLSQNLLPFEWKELSRFGFSAMTLKLALLSVVQGNTFRNADGLIFLTDYARKTVLRAIRGTKAETAVIPHGIDGRFVFPPREQWPIDSYTSESPFSIVYVSILDVYKHQDTIAMAVARLKGEGIPVTVDFVGPSYPPEGKRLAKLFHRLDPHGCFIRYAGPVQYDKLPEVYAKADLCVFASSCENLPIILLEGMAAGLPIACSNRGPMPEVLGDSGSYFDPEMVESVYTALAELIQDPDKRGRLAALSWKKAGSYSWERCADQTFGFLAGLLWDLPVKGRI